MKWVIRRVLSTKILSLIIFISILLRFIGIVPNISNNDEGYILKHSKELFYNIVSKGDFDPHAYKYGSVIFYLQALVYIPFYLFGLVLVNTGLSLPPPKLEVPILDFLEYVSSNFEMFFLWEGRAIIALIGVSTVFLVYLLAKNLFGQKYGIFSALILAINPFHVRDSHYATTDVLLLFFLLLSLLFILKAVNTNKIKWFIASGLIVGISSTIKYFPLAILPLPLVFFMGKQKDRRLLIKIILMLLTIPVGLFIGVPFLFLNPENKTLLQTEVGAQFLWYGTSLTAFLSSLLDFVMSFGKSPILPLSSLIPTEFTEFHSSFLIFKIFGPILFGISILGIFISFLRFPLKTLFVFLIPAFVFIYISFYIPAVFERLSLPIVPFLCIFSAVFFVEIWNFMKKRLDKKFIIASFLSILSIALFYPVTTAFASSWSCGRDVNSESKNWIDQNINMDAKIAQVSPVYLPNKTFREVKEVRPDTEFFLDELQDLDFNYLLINTGLFTRFTYQFENNFFIIPQRLYSSYYVPLALREYELRSGNPVNFHRNEMCDLGNFVFYKLPEKLPEQKTLSKKLNFNNEEEINEWSTESLDNDNSDFYLKFSSSEGHAKKGSLEYSWNRLYYRGPRVSLSKIPVDGGKVYTFSGWIKSKEELTPIQRDGFIRVDFDNGQSFVLSSRIYGKPKWQKISVTTKTPKDAKFAVLSFQAIGTLNINSFYLDDIEILTEE